MTLTSIVYTDTFKAYNQLDVTEFHHMCINHLKLFPDREIKSTGSKTLGTNPSDICEDLMASNQKISIGFLGVRMARTMECHHQSLYKLLKLLNFKSKH